VQLRVAAAVLSTTDSAIPFQYDMRGVCSATVCGIVLLVASSTLLAGPCGGVSWAPSAAEFTEWMTDGGFPITQDDSFPELRSKILGRVAAFLSDLFSVNSLEEAEEAVRLQSKEYPYFGFLPPYMGSLLIDSKAVSWSGVCFKNASAAMNVLDGPGIAPGSTLQVTLSLSHPTSLFCSDLYLFGAMSTVAVKMFASQGSHVVNLTVPADASAAELHDLSTRGVRAFVFKDDLKQTLSDVLNTVLLFGSWITKMPPPLVVEKNVDFLQKYRGLALANRTVQVRVPWLIYRCGARPAWGLSTELTVYDTPDM